MVTVRTGASMLSSYSSCKQIRNYLFEDYPFALWNSFHHKLSLVFFLPTVLHTPSPQQQGGLISQPKPSGTPPSLQHHLHSHMCTCAQSLQSHLTLATPGTIVCQAPLSMRFSKNPGMEPLGGYCSLVTDINWKNCVFVCVCVSLRLHTHTHTHTQSFTHTIDHLRLSSIYLAQDQAADTTMASRALTHMRMSKLQHWTYNGHVWVSLWKTKLQAERLKQKCTEVTAQPWPQVLRWGGSRQGPLWHL